MIQYKQWGSKPFSASELGTEIQITKMPKQFPVKKITITLRAKMVIGAGGGIVDYVIGKDFMQRIFKRIQFLLGSNNLLKDYPGYSNLYMGELHQPSNGTNVGFNLQEGDVLTVGDEAELITTHVIEFEDLNTLTGASTILMPSLYEDLQLNLQISPLSDLITAGDRDYTFNGVLSIVLQQDTDLTAAVTDVLREWTQTVEITSTGTLEVDLPRSVVIEQIGIFPLENSVMSMNQLDTTKTISIDIENGTLILYDLYPQDIITQQLQDYSCDDMKLLFSGQATPFFQLNFDVNHDGYRMFDNRSVTKWTMKLPAIYNALVTGQFLLHFIGRNQMPPAIV